MMARAVAARLPPLIGSNVVVENRPGAGGNIGSAWVAKSAPKDGSVWLVTVNSAQAVNPSLYKSTGFDPIHDFEPVAGIAIVQHAIVVSPKFPANTLAELVALARGTGRDRDEGRAGGARHHHQGRDRALGAGDPRFGDEDRLSERLREGLRAMRRQSAGGPAPDA